MNQSQASKQSNSTLIQLIEQCVVEEMINELVFDIMNACIHYPQELTSLGINKYLLALRRAIENQDKQGFVTFLLSPGILKEKVLKRVKADVFTPIDYSKELFAEKFAKDTLNAYWKRATSK